MQVQESSAGRGAFCRATMSKFVLSLAVWFSTNIHTAPYGEEFCSLAIPPLLSVQRFKCSLSNAFAKILVHLALARAQGPVHCMGHRTRPLRWPKAPYDFCTPTYHPLRLTAVDSGFTNSSKKLHSCPNAPHSNIQTIQHQDT